MFFYFSVKTDTSGSDFFFGENYASTFVATLKLFFEDPRLGGDLTSVCGLQVLLWPIQIWNIDAVTLWNNAVEDDTTHNGGISLLNSVRPRKVDVVLRKEATVDVGENN